MILKFEGDETIEVFSGISYYRVERNKQSNFVVHMLIGKEMVSKGLGKECFVINDAGKTVDRIKEQALQARLVVMDHNETVNKKVISK